MLLRWIRWLASGLAFVYLLGYCCWRLLLLTPLYDRDWRLPLSEVLGSWFYLPLLPLLVLGAIARSRLALLMLVAPLLFFAGEYGAQLLPRWLWLGRVQPGATVVRFMTWNTHLAYDHSGEFRALLTRQQPDLVALQEISYSLARILADEVTVLYPYQQMYGAGSASGLAILSRYPIRAFEINAGVLRCRCMRVTLDIDGQEVTVLNTHVWSPMISIDQHRAIPRVARFDNAHQTGNFSALLDQIAAAPGPLIMLGDFNTTERQPNYRRLNQLLRNAFAEAGWGMGFTFPTNASYLTLRVPPFVRIDHIFFNDAWRAAGAWRGRLVESDHAYVIADLVLLH